MYCGLKELVFFVNRKLSLEMDGMTAETELNYTGRLTFCEFKFWQQ